MNPATARRGDIDQIWLTMVAMVTESRGNWRRKVSEATGLPFSRIRALRSLIERPLTMQELAEEINTDPPAATVAVNDLERRGLVQRQPHPTNRRAKLVLLTDSGRQAIATARRVCDPAPRVLRALPEPDIAELKRIVDSLHHVSGVAVGS